MIRKRSCYKHLALQKGIFQQIFERNLAIDSCVSLDSNSKNANNKNEIQSFGRASLNGKKHSPTTKFTRNDRKLKVFQLPSFSFL